TNAALDSRRLSLLWQREARHLATDDYRLVRRQTRWIAATLDELFLTHDRADLGPAVVDIRSWVLVSIISGHGLYDSPLPRPRLASRRDRGERAARRLAHRTSLPTGRRAGTVRPDRGRLRRRVAALAVGRAARPAGRRRVVAGQNHQDRHRRLRPHPAPATPP